MIPRTKNLLITGRPGVGKTTLIKELARRVMRLNPVGFYTEEIRQQGVRQGFALVSFEGRRSTLSHVSVSSRHRVGRYGVEVVGFEHFLEAIDFHRARARLIIIDEIGRMELFSEKFRRLLKQVLDSSKPVVATIALKGTGPIEEIKHRRDSTLIELTVKNRDSLGETLGSFLERACQPLGTR